MSLKKKKKKERERWCLGCAKEEKWGDTKDLNWQEWGKRKV